MKLRLLSVAVLLASSWVQAQTPAPDSGIAEIVSVEGLVTVTTNNQLTNASKGMPLTEGAQVLTTGSGTATVAFESGCRVTLQPGQSLLIEEEACAAFLAAGGAVTTTTFLSPTMALLGVGGLGVLAISTSGGGTAAPVVPETPVEPTPPAAASPAATAPIAAPAVAPVSGA